MYTRSVVWSLSPSDVVTVQQVCIVYCNVSAQRLLERHTGVGGVLAFLILVCVTNVVLSMACLLVLLRNFVSRVCALTSILTWRVALWVYIFIFLDGQNI